MTDDLVKRLRDYDKRLDWSHVAHPDVCLEAADEIERLVRSRNKWGKLYNQTLKKLRLSVMSDSEYVKIIDEKCAEQADRIEQLEAALFSIYVAPNDQPFIKSQIKSVLDVNEYRQKWGKKKDEQTP